MRPNVSRISRAAAIGSGFPFGPFRIHVNQSHLHGAERIVEFTIAFVALVPAQPLVLGSPVDVLFRLPYIRAPAAETERLEAHRLESDVAGENHEVGPGDFPAIFLLDGPEQPARLVEVHVVRPAVEGRKTLLARPCPAAAIADAVGACAVPRHTNKKPAVVAEVGWPPVLRSPSSRHAGP